MLFPKYLFNEQNAKTIKGEKLGYLTLILYLAPAKSAGMGNVCPYATPGCLAACLNTAGRGVYDNVQESRLNKTRLLFQDREGFLAKMEREITNALERARLLGLKLAVRCNGTSDLPFLELNLAPKFPGVMFYGYTKIPPAQDQRRKLPNVHLTFSYAETEPNQQTAQEVLDSGGNVAMVFSTRRSGTLPKRWKGYTVIDGETHDLRFLDKRATRKGQSGYIVGLRAKGRARHDTSGFVVQVGGGRD